MRRGRGTVLASLLAAMLAGVTDAAAQIAVRPPGDPAAPGSQLTVYLMTMGPGQEVWERFGHNAIWIHDAATDSHVAYNYGLFDFEQEDFLVRFIQGRMRYWMAGFPAERYVQSYVRDNRSVWLQELEIPPGARLELQEFLRWNELPENRFYHYDYYRDNCSTRVRDAIDRVLAGRIRAGTADRPAGVSFRFHTQRLTANDPPIYTGLLLALGPGVDRPISTWEEMFLPLAMRDHFRTLTVPGPDGKPVPLVKSERTLFESTAPAPLEVPPAWLPWYLLLGVAWGGAALTLGRAAARSRGARVGLGAVVVAWALAAGVAGTLLAGLWALTDHEMAYRNENLFQVNPLALVLVVLLPLALARRPRALGTAQRIAFALAGLALLGFALQILPGLDQVNGQIIALTLPVHLGVAGGLCWAIPRGKPVRETVIPSEVRDLPGGARAVPGQDPSPSLRSGSG